MAAVAIEYCNSALICASARTPVQRADERHRVNCNGKLQHSCGGVVKISGGRFRTPRPKHPHVRRRASDESLSFRKRVAATVQRAELQRGNLQRANGNTTATGTGEASCNGRSKRAEWAANITLSGRSPLSGAEAIAEARELASAASRLCAASCLRAGVIEHPRPIYFSPRDPAASPSPGPPAGESGRSEAKPSRLAL